MIRILKKIEQHSSDLPFKQVHDNLIPLTVNRFFSKVIIHCIARLQTETRVKLSISLIFRAFCLTLPQTNNCKRPENWNRSDVSELFYQIC